MEPIRQKKALGDEAEVLEVMDELQDICEQIDFAMSLVQIGGMPTLLEMCHPATGLSDELRSAALGIVATVTQNNPYTQNALFNLNTLPMIVGIATDGANSTTLRLKAIHAISCMIRSFPPLEHVFFTGVYPSVTNFTDEGVFVEGSEPTTPLAPLLSGPQVLASFLSNSDIRVQRKGAFLVGALITGQEDVGADKLDGYYSACIQGLVSLVGPFTTVVPEGEPGHGLDIDLREITLQTLAYFAERGKWGDMLRDYGAALTASRTAASERVTAGVDVENAKAEASLWTDLFATAQ